MKLRVSFIEYLNSVPLGWGFLYGPHRDAFEVLFDVPAECARRLSTGQADLGLIPAIEYQRIPGLSILPNLAIASKKEVKSVLFVSKLPLHKVRRVAVDASSRTSVALLRIFLESFRGYDPAELHQEAPQPERMLKTSDAALIIGNPALQVSRDRFRVYDLAREWYKFTGLPFVFAVWAVGTGVQLGDQERIFYESLELGLSQVDQIANTYSEKLDLPPAEIRQYITENLDFSLDEANLRGLETFFQEAARLGLTPTPRPLKFYGQESW